MPLKPNLYITKYNQSNNQNNQNNQNNNLVKTLNTISHTNSNQINTSNNNNHYSHSNLRFSKTKYINQFIAYKKRAIKKLYLLRNKKYNANKNSWNIRVIDDIIYNEKSHLVSVFKDYLIYDDNSEFMKRFYTIRESTLRIPKIVDYYINNTKIIPNYSIMSGASLVVRCYKKKTRLEKQIAEDLKNNKYKTINYRSQSVNNNDEKVFNKKLIESIDKIQPSLSHLDHIDTSTNLNNSSDSMFEVFINLKALLINNDYSNMYYGSRLNTLNTIDDDNYVNNKIYENKFLNSKISILKEKFSNKTLIDASKSPKNNNNKISNLSIKNNMNTINTEKPVNSFYNKNNNTSTNENVLDNGFLGTMSNINMTNKNKPDINLKYKNHNTIKVNNNINTNLINSLNKSKLLKHSKKINFSKYPSAASKEPRLAQKQEYLEYKNNNNLIEVNNNLANNKQGTINNKINVLNTISENNNNIINNVNIVDKRINPNLNSKDLNENNRTNELNVINQKDKNYKSNIHNNQYISTEKLSINLNINVNNINSDRSNNNSIQANLQFLSNNINSNNNTNNSTTRDHQLSKLNSKHNYLTNSYTPINTQLDSNETNNPILETELNSHYLKTHDSIVNTTSNVNIHNLNIRKQNETSYPLSLKKEYNHLTNSSNNYGTISAVTYSINKDKTLDKIASSKNSIHNINIDGKNKKYLNSKITNNYLHNKPTTMKQQILIKSNDKGMNRTGVNFGLKKTNSGALRGSINKREANSNTNNNNKDLTNTPCTNNTFNNDYNKSQNYNNSNNFSRENDMNSKYMNTITEAVIPKTKTTLSNFNTHNNHKNMYFSKRAASNTNNNVNNKFSNKLENKDEDKIFSTNTYSAIDNPVNYSSGKEFNLKLSTLTSHHNGNIGNLSSKPTITSINSKIESNNKQILIVNNTNNESKNNGVNAFNNCNRNNSNNNSKYLQTNNSNSNKNNINNNSLSNLNNLNTFNKSNKNKYKTIEVKQASNHINPLKSSIQLSETRGINLKKNIVIPNLPTTVSPNNLRNSTNTKTISRITHIAENKDNNVKQGLIKISYDEITQNNNNINNKILLENKTSNKILNNYSTANESPNNYNKNNQIYQNSTGLRISEILDTNNNTNSNQNNTNTFVYKPNNIEKSTIANSKYSLNNYSNLGIKKNTLTINNNNNNLNTNSKGSQEFIKKSIATPIYLKKSSNNNISNSNNNYNKNFISANANLNNSNNTINNTTNKQFSNNYNTKYSSNNINNANNNALINNVDKRQNKKLISKYSKNNSIINCINTNDKHLSDSLNHNKNKLSSDSKICSINSNCNDEVKKQVLASKNGSSRKTGSLAYSKFK